MGQILLDAIRWLREDPARSQERLERRGVQYHLTFNESTITPDIALASYVAGELSTYDSGWTFWGPIEHPIPYRWERIAGSGVPAFHDTYVQEHLARQDFDLSQQASVDLAVIGATPGPNGVPYQLDVELMWGGHVLALTDHRWAEDVLFAQADASPDRPRVNQGGYTITFKKVIREG